MTIGIKIESAASNLPRTKKRRWLHGRSLCLEIKICPPDAYPDLINNPSNPYNLLSDEERLRDFINALSILWSETCHERAQKIVDGTPKK
jgi:hypothetical protein